MLLSGSVHHSNPTPTAETADTTASPADHPETTHQHEVETSQTGRLGTSESHVTMACLGITLLPEETVSAPGISETVAVTGILLLLSFWF